MRTPAYYRLTSPLCLPIVLAHTSAVCSLSALTHNQLIWWYCLFRTSAIFGPLPLVLARVLFSHCAIAWLHRSYSNERKRNPQIEYALCFLQFEQYTVIKSTEELYFFSTADVKKRYCFRPWPMHQLHFYLSVDVSRR